jgi:hypothetical protein
MCLLSFLKHSAEIVNLEAKQIFRVDIFTVDYLWSSLIPQNIDFYDLSAATVRPIFPIGQLPFVEHVLLSGWLDKQAHKPIGLDHPLFQKGDYGTSNAAALYARLALT